MQSYGLFSEYANKKLCSLAYFEMQPKTSSPAEVPCRRVYDYSNNIKIFPTLPKKKVKKFGHLTEIFILS